MISAVDSAVGFTPAQLKMWSRWVYFSIMEVMKLLQESVELMLNAVVRWLPGLQKVRVEAREVGLRSVRARVAPRWESFTGWVG